LGKDAPADVKQAFGYYVIEFSRLEFILQLCTWSAIGAGDLRIGWALTGGDTFSRMVEHCSRMVKLRAPDDSTRSQFEALHQRLRDAGTRRNQVLHAFCGWDEDADSLYTFRVGRAGVPEPHVGPTTAAEVTVLGDEVRALSKDFGLFAMAFMKVGPSRDGRDLAARRLWDGRWDGGSGRLVRAETARHRSTTNAAKRCRVATSDLVPRRARHVIIIRGSSVRVRPPLLKFLLCAFVLELLDRRLRRAT